MTKDMFLAAVRAALLANPHPMVNGKKESERGAFSEFVSDMFLQEWSVEDAIAYMSLTQEFNPTLKEEVALAAMSAIRSKYN